MKIIDPFRSRLFLLGLIFICLGGAKGLKAEVPSTSSAPTPTPSVPTLSQIPTPTPTLSAIPVPSADHLQGRWDYGRHSVTPFRYRVSSGYGGNYSARNLFDSNPLTNWMSERRKSPEWILVDFEEKRLLNRVVIVFPSWGFFREIGHYEIQVNVWGEWRTISQNQNPKRTNVHHLPGMDASQIRVYFPDAENTPVVVADLQLFFGDKLLNGTESRLTGYIFPIEGGVLPEDDYSLPGAPRTYRNGYHKGVDIRHTRGSFFNDQRLTPVDFRTKILSIGDGVVVRADLDYLPMVVGDFERQKELTKKFPVTYVDRDFGGRQVWIDHGNGVISTYNHLDRIEKGIMPGIVVSKGQVIGRAGNSGLQGEAQQNSDGIHLHMEIWVDGEYLGKGLTAKQSRGLLEIFFSR